MFGMINSEELDPKNQPLLRDEKRIRIKEEKYSLRIMLCLMYDSETPKIILDESKNSEAKKSFENKYYRDYLALEKQKGAHIIYVTPDDFEKDKDNLKEDVEIQRKYEIFSRVDERTKIKIFGHGLKDPTHKILTSANHYSYTVEKIISIFELIQNTKVRLDLNTFKEHKKLPDHHLRVSVIACNGENFARILMGALKRLTSTERRWALSIVAGKKSKEVALFNPKKYVNDGETYLRRIFTPVSILSFIAQCCLIPLAIKRNNYNLVYGSIAVFGATGLYYLAFFTEDCIEKCREKNPSNSRHKVVFFTNFDKDSHKYYYTFSTKNYFKKLHPLENTDANIRGCW